MSLVDPRAPLADDHRKILARAVSRLEGTSLAKRLSDYASQPINSALKKIPKPLGRRIDAAVEKAILRCLNVAVNSLEKETMHKAPRTRRSSILAAASGGLGGLFGAASLPVELPVTTMLMLRSIADIARHYGEDLSTLEARLACVEVFALGAKATPGRTHFGYYASRALLGHLTSDAANFFVERGVAGASATVAGRLASEVAARFGLALSERTAVSALPLVGAVGGAAVNVVFMRHFQSIARGHFIVRRLERIYGEDSVRREYMIIADELAQAREKRRQ
jgi:hypothetical protein